MSAALNGWLEKAARIVAAYEACRLTPAQDESLSVAFAQFLREFVPAANLSKSGLHVRLPAQNQGLRRPLHLFALTERGHLRATLTMNDAHEKDGRPRTPDDLRKMALDGNSRFFAQREIWLNPYWEGRIRSEILWWGAEPLWSQCGNPRAGAARLAWEAVSESAPWRWKFEQSRREPAWLDGEPNPKSQFSESHRDDLAAICQRAGTLLPSMIQGSGSVPLTIFQNRGDASILDALAYHLVADPAGRRLPWTVAAKVLGYYSVDARGRVKNDWRVLYSAVRSYRRAHPGAHAPPRGPRAKAHHIRPGRNMTGKWGE